MKVSVAIQHHPSRADLLPPLLEQLPGAEVVTDPDAYHKTRSPWRTYRLALEGTPADATHRLIVQDDAILCDNFLEAASRAISAKPDAAVAFYHGKFPAANLHRLRNAQAEGQPWAVLNPDQFLPVVALSWPKEHALGLPLWVDEQPWRSDYVCDDAAAGRYAVAVGMRAYATCPSLVEHPDEPSIGRRHTKSLMGRQALSFIGDGDALAIVWG